MDTPSALFETSLRMMPRLEAEESILAVNRAAVAAGTLTKDASQRLTARWERLVTPSRATTGAHAPRPLPNVGLGLKLTPSSKPATAHG